MQEGLQAVDQVLITNLYHGGSMALVRMNGSRRGQVLSISRCRIGYVRSLVEVVMR